MKIMFIAYSLVIEVSVVAVQGQRLLPICITVSVRFRPVFCHARPQPAKVVRIRACGGGRAACRHTWLAGGCAMPVVGERRLAAVPGGDALVGASCHVPGDCLGLATAAGKKKRTWKTQVRWRRKNNGETVVLALPA